MKVHRFIFALVCGLAFLGFVGGLQAQEKYPSRPVELTVVMAPGGVADLAARIYSEELNKLLKVPVTVVNRAGGSGTQGTAYAARARNDGYTLVQVNESPILTMPIISKEVTYDPLKDLTPLAYFVTMPSFIAVRSDSPFKTLDDLVAYARQNPGKLRNSTGPLWTSSHVGLEIFCTSANIKIVTIPYGSGGEAVAALLGGNLDLISLVPSAVAPHIKAGKIRALAFTSRIKDPNFPDVPTTEQLGYRHETFDGWLGVFAPSGIPQQTLDVLVPALEKTFKNPDIVERFAKIGCIVQYMGPKEFKSYIEARIPIMRKIAQDANLMQK
jgi:tripartite-type tricarboxylate transporter receptor subunit TctC